MATYKLKISNKISRPVTVNVRKTSSRVFIHKQALAPHKWWRSHTLWATSGCVYPLPFCSYFTFLIVIVSLSSLYIIQLGYNTLYIALLCNALPMALWGVLSSASTISRKFQMATFLMFKNFWMTKSTKSTRFLTFSTIVYSFHSLYERHETNWSNTLGSCRPNRPDRFNSGWVSNCFLKVLIKSLQKKRTKENLFKIFCTTKTIAIKAATS